MKKLIASSALSLACVVAPAAASAFVLDFETASTGLTLDAAPLVTPLGTVTLGVDNRCSRVMDVPNNAGTGTVLCGFRSGANANDGFLSLYFDFAVSSVTFVYDGQGLGGFTAELLDGAGNVLDALNLGSGILAGTATLDGVDAREFRFKDPVAATSAIDDLRITAGDLEVPEPASLALFGLALVGVAASRKRVRK